MRDNSSWCRLRLPVHVGMDDAGTRANNETDNDCRFRGGLLRHRDRGRGLRADRFGHSPPPETGNRNAVDRGGKAVPRACRRTGQQHRHQPGEYATHLAAAGGRQPQLRAGGRIVGASGTRGRQIRVHSGRWSHSGSQAQSSEAGFPVVRKLEERAFELRSLLGEEGLPTVPAHPHPRGQEHRTAQHLRRRQPRRRRARLSCPDAAHQGSGWPRAHRGHDAGGKRSGRAARFPRPLRGSEPGVCRPGPQGTDGLSTDAPRHTRPGTARGVGGQRIQNRRHVGGSIRAGKAG